MSYSATLQVQPAREEKLNAIASFAVSCNRSVRARPAAPSVLAACLQRFESAGLQMVVTAPADTGHFARGLSRFPERSIDPAAHARWTTAYQMFSGSGDRAHDRGSWRILAADADGRVRGAITARFFCGEIISPYLRVNSLLRATGPVFRDLCELAVQETYTKAKTERCTPGEFSDWEIEHSQYAPLLGVALAHGITSLASAFDRVIGVAAADQRRCEFSRLFRFGGSLLARHGKLFLPPFIHHATGARLRLMQIDTARVNPRLRAGTAADLAVLREWCPIISPA